MPSSFLSLLSIKIAANHIGAHWDKATINSSRQPY
jgi:hypothetical protein